MKPEDALQKLFDAERALRDAEQTFLDGKPEALVPVLERAVKEHLADESDDAAYRLMRVADLCAQVPGPAMTDALIAILGHGNPAVRVEAGEALLDVAYARFKEVARSIERALDRKDDSVAMEELPFILAEVRDPDPFKLIARFLEHGRAEVVAAAIEALAGMGDPNAIPHLEALVDDEREAVLEDMDDEPVAIGQLARAALDEAFGVDGHDHDHDHERDA